MIEISTGDVLGPDGEGIGNVMDEAAYARK